MDGGGTGLGILIEFVVGAGAEAIIVFWPIDREGAGLGEAMDIVGGAGAEVIVLPIPDKNFFTSWSCASEKGSNCASISS